MAYSSVWSNTRPQGTVAANTIDEEIQQVRVDVNDRISDLFGIADFTLGSLIPMSIPLNRTATSKILGGTTSFSIRDHTDAADNLIVLDTGAVSVRTGLSVLGTGGLSVAGGGAAITGNVIATGNLQGALLALGTNPASIGIIRIPSASIIMARNAANTNDLSLIYADGADRVRIGAGTGATFIDGGYFGVGNYGGTARTAGDIIARRSANTGYLYFGEGANTYVGFDGAQYVFGSNGSSANLTVNGQATASQFNGPLNGNATTATTSAACSGNAATATTAGNATNLGGVAAASYALLSDTRNFVTTGTVTAHGFFVV